jgi:hypothetical protein
MTTFTNAISAAQAVNTNAAASQNAIDGAVSTLNTAQTTFTGAINTAATDKTALAATIEQANAAKTGVAESEIDLDTGKWVLPEDMTTFNAAITAAQTVLNITDATQNAVDAAASTLDAAISAFNGKVKRPIPGTASVSLTFWVNEDNQIIASSDSVTISKTGADDYSTSFSAAVIDGYDSVTWSVNGAQKSDNGNVVIAATDYYTGAYRLGVIVTKDDVPYSTEITFTVTN